MSFNKPFRAVPIELGRHYRAKARRQARAELLGQTLRTLVGGGAMAAVGYAAWTWAPADLPSVSTSFSGPTATAYYARCSDARAAGAAPIYRGQPGYRSELDRDDDGVACEPYRGR